MLRNPYDDSYVKEKERNVVFIGFNNEEKSKNTFISGREYIFEERAAVFPKIYYYENLKDAKRMHGYSVYIKVDYDLKYVKDNVVELDKYYRKKFRSFKSIILYSELFKIGDYVNFGSYSTLGIIDKETLFNPRYNYFDYVFETYRKYCIDYKTLKLSKPKMEKLSLIRIMLKENKGITTKSLSTKLGISERNIQRYMHDMNELYNEIGYDESKNMWYKV